MHERGIWSAGRGLASASLLLAACSANSPDEAPPPLPPAPQTRYDMANACYALQALANEQYAQRGEDGGYGTAAGEPDDATPFFMKPTALGRYFFYAEDKSLMAATAGAVGSITAPGAAADWTVDGDAHAGFTVYSDTAARYLAVDAADGRLVLSAEPARFGFEAAEGCTPYPEIALNLQGQTYKGQGVDKPVLGFAEVHAHISATDFLGGGHYGWPFHRYGVTEALGDCELQHGPDGRLDLVGNLMGGSGSPLATHDTQGWPSFVDWPHRDSLMHEGMYYRWVERAYMAGMRILVNDLVENEVLCSLQTVANVANGLQLDLGEIVQNVADIVAPPSCNEMDSAERQAQYMHAMQDYIDAQSGGPGEGWFRIVTTPQQAREVIHDGKLAVVLGIEISHLFNCKVSKPGGFGEGVSSCDEAEIDAQLQRAYDLGVRQAFPLHEFDNGLGGNGIFDGLILNIGNFIDTGGFWETYACPQQPYFFEAGADMTTALPVDTLNPLTELLGSITQGLVPVYPVGKQCNSRWFTPLGEYAIQRMMDQKMIIEVDHMDLTMKDQLLDMAEARDPVYPLVSTHGGHGGISMEQAARLLAGGGILYPSKGNGRQFNAQRELLRTVQQAGRLFAMGYGADMNGLAHQSGPRGSEAEPVEYPITLFRGPGWGQQFARLQPLVVEQSAVPEGNRYFDINTEGLAHYGMIADWVEEVRLEGGEPAITDLYNSAELYLQMWERTVER